MDYSINNSCRKLSQTILSHSVLILSATLWAAFFLQHSGLHSFCNTLGCSIYCFKLCACLDSISPNQSFNGGDRWELPKPAECTDKSPLGVRSIIVWTSVTKEHGWRLKNRYLTLVVPSIVYCLQTWNLSLLWRINSSCSWTYMISSYALFLIDWIFFTYLRFDIGGHAGDR